MADEKIRLQKYMADNGVASRRKSEELIENGFVKVNGRKAKLGDKVNPKKDLVLVNGKKIKKENTLRYIMLHKPRGFITTMNDEKNRKCVAQLISDVDERVYPVGRLDKESEGLLLFTNDGEFANAMTHPKKHVPKIYRVTIKPKITDEQIAQLESGVVIDGKMTAPAEVRVVKKEEGRVVIEMTLYEGRNREIRKMCEELSLEVARLKRIAVGSVKLGMLQQGKWRDLTELEINKLMTLAGMDKPKAKRGK
ncbi:MAG: rRNA pseudouridine synthase [Clostridiales bacterium]|nr:rRNA pseudouridine synthase [Clostridiales bacterium]